MSKNSTPAAIPTFGSVSVETLPEAVRASSPATLALGQAIIAAMTDGNAAVDPETYADRKAGTTRAAVLKRAVAAVDKNLAVTGRVYSEDGKFRVAILRKSADEADAAETPAADA